MTPFYPRLKISWERHLAASSTSRLQVFQLGNTRATLLEPHSQCLAFGQTRVFHSIWQRLARQQEPFHRSNHPPAGFSYSNGCFARQLELCKLARRLVALFKSPFLSCCELFAAKPHKLASATRHNAA
ncbi:hypothetical protein TOPH_08414 [Tolypocladium ophioglossoides CBS 100239]|uniref:Uncharacterized protein n=1 Tax=Tolypocladium ophioglossoides (strain CBS 100239) TaxID=1163406 RepID=A0A0L0MYL2_TOLOC|nr:hypothetical protein TOPH_08414 [Tolypocladium ophioglossoides CBS 100239]